MDNVLNFLNDPENPLANFNLAFWYESQGQSGAAISFYLRAAERSPVPELSYESLVRSGNVIYRLGNNNFTAKGYYQAAICLMPKRPEAYYLLSRLQETTKDWAESYTTACVGLNTADFSLKSLPTGVGYPGKYAIIFEKAVSAWWWGKPTESRNLFMMLKDLYREVMDDNHLEAVQTNLSHLGIGPESQAFNPYDVSKHAKLKVKFKGSENIDRNYSQVYQDMFVLTMLNGKRDGTYLEVGGADPYLGNNTAILEQRYGWKGISIEYNEDLCKAYRSNRKNPVICKNALEINYNKLLKELTDKTDIDYLQLDCEPSRVTFEILLLIPFEKYRFGVITYEHDHYVDVSGLYRERSRNYLKMMGYELIVGDVSPDGKSSFEDWWVHPALISSKMIEKMKCLSQDVKKAEDYMFGKIA